MLLLISKLIFFEPQSSMINTFSTVSFCYLGIKTCVPVWSSDPWMEYLLLHKKYFIVVSGSLQWGCL